MLKPILDLTRRTFSLLSGKSKLKTGVLKKFQQQHTLIRTTINPRNTLAIVIPAYRHALYLPQALQSILYQTRTPDEIIIINDHSPDETHEVVMAFKEEYPQLPIRYFRNEINLGQAASLNKAISTSTCDLVMILNDDDYLLQNIVEVAIDYLRKNEEVHLFGGSSIWLASGENPENNELKIQLPISDLTITSPAMVLGFRNINDINLTHSSSCFTKVAWKEVGGYYTNKKKRLVPFSDRDFQLRIALCFQTAFTKTTPFAFWRSYSSVDSKLNS